MDLDVFLCKIKKRPCVFCFFSPLFTFVELKTTKTLRVVKKSVLPRCFLQTRGLVLSLDVSQNAWKITENVDAGDHRRLFRQGTYLKLTQFNFQTNRSLGAVFARGTTPALSIFFCPVTLTAAFAGMCIKIQGIPTTIRRSFVEVEILIEILHEKMENSHFRAFWNPENLLNTVSKNVEKEKLS